MGEWIETQKAPGNDFVYERKEHDNARIANLIAESAADNGQKQAWYDEWVRLTALQDKAVKVYKESQRGEPLTGALADDVLDEIRRIAPSLGGKAVLERFERRGQTYRMRQDPVSWSETDGDHAQNSQMVIRRMINALDDRRNGLEATVMADVDPTYRNRQRDLLEAQDLRAKLVQLYSASRFPKSTIDRALDLVAKSDLVREKFQISEDRGQYQSRGWFGFGMTSFLKSIADEIGRRVLELELRRDERFGAGAGRNDGVDPEIGQAYGIVGGGFSDRRGERWNWHWAGVILKTATDNVTMEAHRSYKRGNETHNDLWDIEMYGRPSASGARTTFHDVWRGRGFGTTPVTVLGQAAFIADARAARYNLTGITLEQVWHYQRDVSELFEIMAPLKGMASSRNAILHYYDRNTPDVEAIMAALPRNLTHPHLTVDLQRQQGAVEALADETDRTRQLDLEVDIHDAAVDLTAELSDLYGALKTYEGNLARRGGVAQFKPASRRASPARDQSPARSPEPRAAVRARPLHAAQRVAAVVQFGGNSSKQDPNALDQQEYARLVSDAVRLLAGKIKFGASPGGKFDQRY